MAHIQMTDLNPSDLEFMEELTDGELLAINGGRVSTGNHSAFVVNDWVLVNNRLTTVVNGWVYTGNRLVSVVNDWVWLS